MKLRIKNVSIPVTVHYQRMRLWRFIGGMQHGKHQLRIVMDNISLELYLVFLKCMVYMFFSLYELSQWKTLMSCYLFRFPSFNSLKTHEIHLKFTASETVWMSKNIHRKGSENFVQRDEMLNECVFRFMHSQ